MTFLQASAVNEIVSFRAECDRLVKLVNQFRINTTESNREKDAHVKKKKRANDGDGR